jgi:hypothetical protein
MYAWAAGFIDGEANLAIRRASVPKPRGVQHRARIAVKQISPVPLERLVELFGSRVLQYETTPIGNPIYEWHLHGSEHVAAALEKLLPYLVLKHDAAEILLRFCRGAGRRPPGRGLLPQAIFDEREALRLELRALSSHRG